MEIRPIPIRSSREIPRNVIQELPRPVVSAINIPKPISPPPPVVRGISPPVVNVPDTSIEYPTIDLQTEEEFRGDMSPPQQTPQSPPTSNTRDIPTTPTVTVPSFEVGGVVVPLPDPAPIAAAGVMAIATTIAALGTTVLFTQLKSGMDPVLKKIAAKRKKVKIKKTKTVLHFIPDDNNVQVLEYGSDGVKIISNNIENLEQYLRDQVDMNSFYEYDNKLIIDDIMKDKFSKEGAKRFSRHFATPKSVAKKLGAKFSF